MTERAVRGLVRARDARRRDQKRLGRRRVRATVIAHVDRDMARDGEFDGRIPGCGDMSCRECRDW